jgi:hypothetical protein
MTSGLSVRPQSIGIYPTVPGELEMPGWTASRPAIHVLLAETRFRDVDARHKAGHHEMNVEARLCRPPLEPFPLFWTPQTIDLLPAGRGRSSRCPSQSNWRPTLGRQTPHLAVLNSTRRSSASLVSSLPVPTIISRDPFPVATIRPRRARSSSSRRSLI